MFLHINVAQAEDEQQYGICGWYNELYYIPEFGNVELADIVTKNVTIASGNRAVGLKAADEESILQDIRVPAAEIDLGYLTNSQERSLLSQSAYREKLADGIADAIREVYSSYYE
jgi:N-acetylmuramoyl-L-alanine amidase